MNFLLIILTTLLLQRPSVSGIVLKTEINEPLSKVDVELRTESGDTRLLMTRTEDDGQFLFWNVPPGRYRIAAIRSGYVRTESIQLTVIAGEPITNIRIAMPRSAAISGRIFGGSGQPLGNAAVSALKASYPEGGRELQVVQSTRTNDQGEYRLFWLSPGSYYLTAVPTEGFAVGPIVMNPDGVNIPGSGIGRSSAAPAGLLSMPPPPPRMDRLPGLPGLTPPQADAFVPIFFPGTADPQTASAIDLRPGAEFRGADINVAPIRTRRVRGVVLNAGRPVGDAQVALLSTTNPNRESSYSGSTDATSGAFEIAGVVPGSYALMATSGALTGRVALEIRDRDSDNISLSIAAGFNIVGRIVIEGQTSSNNPNVTGLRVTLRPDPPIAGSAIVTTRVGGGFISMSPLEASAPTSAVLADGSFVLPRVPPGDFRIFVSPILLPPAPPAGNRIVDPPPAAVPAALKSTYVKSVRLGTQDILNGGLHIERQPPGQIEIVIGTNPASLNGRVVTEKAQPAVGVTVALLPNAARRRRMDLYRIAVTDQSGRFQLAALPPGEYDIFAWEDVERGAWQNPDFMRLYEDRGKTIRIGEGSGQDIEVIAIPRR